jgi:hypothetical protein
MEANRPEVPPPAPVQAASGGGQADNDEQEGAEVACQVAAENYEPSTTATMPTTTSSAPPEAAAKNGTIPPGNETADTEHEEAEEEAQYDHHVEEVDRLARMLAFAMSSHPATATNTADGPRAPAPRFWRELQAKVEETFRTRAACSRSPSVATHLTCMLLSALELSPCILCVSPPTLLARWRRRAQGPWHKGRPPRSKRSHLASQPARPLSNQHQSRALTTSRSSMESNCPWLCIWQATLTKVCLSFPPSLPPSSLPDPKGYLYCRQS